MRKKTDGLAALIVSSYGYELDLVKMGSGVPLEIVKAQTTGKEFSPGAVLWCHGGGYTAGRAFAYRGGAAELSGRMRGVDVVLVDVRFEVWAASC